MSNPLTSLLGLLSAPTGIRDGQSLLDRKELSQSGFLDDRVKGVAASKLPLPDLNIQPRLYELGKSFILTPKLSATSKVLLLALGVSMLQLIPGGQLLSSFAYSAAGLGVVALYLSYQLGMVVKGQLPSFLDTFKNLLGFGTAKTAAAVDENGAIKSVLDNTKKAEKSPEGVAGWVQEFTDEEKKTKTLQERTKVMTRQNWGKEFEAMNRIAKPAVSEKWVQEYTQPPVISKDINIPQQQLNRINVLAGHLQSPTKSRKNVEADKAREQTLRREQARQDYIKQAQKIRQERGLANNMAKV